MNNETKIGILVFTVLAALAVLTWKAGGFDFRPSGYEVTVLFKNIDGVDKNSPVTVNGFEVGRVKSVEITYDDTTRVELTLWLDESARLHDGAVATIRNMGFMGEKYIALTTGDDGQPFLGPGAVLTGEEPADFQKLISDGQDIAENIKSITASIDERLKVNEEAIDGTITNLAKATGHIASISEVVDNSLAKNKAMVNQTIAHIHDTSANMEELSFDLKENPWKLLYRPRPSRNVEP